MKIIKALLLFSFALLLISCGEDFSDDEAAARIEFENYIAKIGLDDSLKKESGVYVVIDEEGGETVPQAGDDVLISYTCYNINNDTIEYFYSNKELEAKAYFTLFDNGVIGSTTLTPIGALGLHEGLLSVHEGGKAHIYVPFEQAYQHREYQGLPRFTSFVFEVELISVRETVSEIP